ncbi:domain zinc finger 1-like [Octopus vulgaris]|nr:domain zinc finger 1-like [Octopus vulgaris]
MGVITLSDIDYGQIFGPFPISQTKADPATFIGLLTKDKQVDTILLKVDLMVDKDRTVEWLPYIQPARDEDEQNIEAYMKDGYVYYRALRIIRKNEDLFVWYSKDFSQILAIPEVQRKQRDSDPYICPRCGEVFEYPFPLRAHLRFTCEPRSLMTLNANQLISRQERQLKLESIESHLENSRIKNCPRALEFHTIQRENDSKNDSPSVIKDYSRNVTIMEVSRKRHLDDTDTLTPSPKLANSENYTKVERKTLDNGINKSQRISPPFSSDNCENTFKFREESEENRSAFTKVEKSHSPKNGITNSTVSNHSNSTTMSNHLITSLPSPLLSSKASLSPAISMTFTGSHYTIPSLTNVRLSSASSGSLASPADLSHVTNANTLYLPRYPVFPSFGLTSAAVAAAAAQPLSDNNSQHSIMEIYKSGLVHTTEQFGSENGITFPKHPIFHERPTVNPFMKTQNPMVEKIIAGTAPSMLQTPLAALTLSQNWCAKCNATFRMTSDLVYHMRSHHKREFDPMKRKREDKLKCSICNETFRERHHLTRHMTSHV